jgi:hypothetical protein
MKSVPAVPSRPAIPLPVHHARWSGPWDLEIPADLSERFWMDETHERLAFRGCMHKATYDRLQTLSNDAEYHHALQELFQLSSLAEPSRRQARMLQIGLFMTWASFALLAAILVCVSRFSRLAAVIE